MTMLDRIRRRKNGLKWILGLVVLAFVFFYVPDFLGDQTSAAPNDLTEVVATVEGHSVTAGDFRRRYQVQLQAFQGASGESLNEGLLRQLGIDRQILQAMVDEKAALAEAERQGIEVSKPEVAHQILAMPSLQENGVFIGQDRYTQILRAQRPPMTPADFETALRYEMMINRLRTAVTGWMSGTDADVEREYRHRNEKVRLQVVSVPSLGFLEKVSVTDVDLAAHFESHKEQYRIGERRTIKYVLVDFEQARNRTTVPEADVLKLYNDNLPQYSSPEQIRASHIFFRTEEQDEAAVRKRAEAVLQQVKSGGDFAALATEHTEDEATRTTGGDLDYFDRGRMAPEFENVAFGMQSGQVSDLVKAPYGFHIIKLVDKKIATTRALAEVRAELTDQLKFQRSQQAVTEQAKELAAKIKTVADLETVTKQAGLEVVESGPFTRDEPIPGVGLVSQAAQEAFRLKDGEISAVVGTPRGPILFTLSSTTAPRLPALDEVTTRVKDDLVAERSGEMALSRAASLATTLKRARNFVAAAKAEGLTVTDTDLLARRAAIPEVGVSPDVDRAAFALPANGVSDAITTTSGAVVVRVAERHDVTPEEFNGAKAAFRREYDNERRTQFFTAYMDKAKQDMAITVNEEALQRIIGDQ